MKCIRFKAILAGISAFSICATASAQSIFDLDFGSSADGALSVNWGGQASWQFSGGNLVGTGGWGRAENFTTFRAEVGETIRITLTDLKFTGAGVGSNDLFAFGFANKPEDTGNQNPQTRAELQFTGTSLSIGGATDTAYDAGTDLVTVVLEFTRLNDGAWDLVSDLTNTTDGSNVRGATITASNLNGQNTASNGLTTAAYMDADPDNSLQFGLRAVGGHPSTNVVSIGGVTLDVVPVPELSAYAYSVAFGGLSLVLAQLRRRKQASTQ